MIEDSTKSLYIDISFNKFELLADDFLVAIGKTKTNSVYHVLEITSIKQRNRHMKRVYFKCLKTDLLTALKRDPEQALTPFQWYKREKKNGK